MRVCEGCILTPGIDDLVEINLESLSLEDETEELV